MTLGAPQLIVYQIPVCPFSQRLAILIELKRLSAVISFHVVDITKPRSDWLTAKSSGTTALPILETEQGQIIKESLVILRYLEDRFPDPPVLQLNPYRRAVEGMLVAMEGDFTAAGYRFVMNQDVGRREGLQASTHWASRPWPPRDKYVTNATDADLGLTR